jgi:hypothetical protein
MKNILLLAGLVFIGGLSATAQPGIQASEREQIKELFRKDTSYDRFRTELKLVMKTAKGPNSNLAAVKKLFTKNKSMLARMVSKNKIILSTKPNFGPITSNIPTVFGELPQNKGIYTRRQTHIAPYDNQFTGGFDMPRQLEEVNSDPAIGKIGYKYDNDEETGTSLGASTVTFTEKIPAPNDPLLVTARVEFQYSFTVTGWDSKFANFEIGLYLRCMNFRNDAFFALPPVTSSEYMERCRKVNVLLPRVYVEEDIESFSKTIDGSFIIDGYIDPMADTNFRIEAAYGLGDKGGLFGSYHYGEFKLKRVIVSYYKAGN